MLATATSLWLFDAVHDRDEEGGHQSGSDRRYAAFTICTDLVHDRLVPERAVFRDYFQDHGEVSVSGTGTGPFTVRSTVESGSAVGSLHRSRFVCTVHTADGEHWALDELTISR